MHLKMSSHNDQGEGVGARDASTHLKMSSYISIRVRAIWTGSSVVSTLSIKSAIQVIIPLQSYLHCHLCCRHRHDRHGHRHRHRHCHDDKKKLGGFWKLLLSTPLLPAHGHCNVTDSQR